MIIQAYPNPIDLSQPFPLGYSQWKDNGALSEIAGRSLLITLMAIIGMGTWQRVAVRLDSPDPLSLLDTLGDLGAVAFAGTVCLLAVLRLQPVRSASGLVPVVSALGGAFILTAINYLPTSPIPEAVSSLGILLLAAGNVAMVYCLIHLGRSFSVLPQARRLVSSGPYGLVRHPLYVAEAVATIGMILLHLDWTVVSLGLLQFGLQLTRIHYEESVLTEAFPEYRDYARRVPRFFPRLRG